MARPAVVYLSDEKIGMHASPEASLRKPHIVRLTDQLIKAYGLGAHMMIAECGTQWEPALARNIRRFHTDAYVHFLQQIELHGKDIAEDASNFVLNPSVCFSETAWLYSQVYTGASIWAAQRLVAGMSDIAINWSGGQTHARRDCASGFSYINDTVLATLYLLQGFQRVLFVNLDACHASGMEEAFYTTDRVLCVSLHRHGDGFFPGSGGARDSGQEAGQHHNINLPVREGLTDADLGMLFTPVIAAAAQRYQPQAVIICAGTGILSGDRLGCMNITLDGYLGALRSLLAMKRPTLLLGGSGYTQSTALRAWCAATALACGVELPDTIPDHEFFLYYSPKYRLRLDPSTLHNKNTIETLTATRDTALEIVRAIPTHEPRLLPPITVPSIEAHSSAGNFSLGGLGADEALAPSPNPDAERAPVGGMMRPGSVPHLSGVSGTRKGIGAAGATAGSVKEAVGTESSNSRAGVAAGNSLPAPQPMELDTEFNVERRPTLAPLPHSGLPLADPPPAPAAKGE